MVTIALSRRQETALQALLTHHTVRAAAQATRISERTFYNYLDNPEFSSRYTAIQGDMTRGVANQIRQHMGEAVQVVAEIMQNPNAPNRERLSASKIFLEHGGRIVENQDIIERQETLLRLLGEDEK